MKISHGLPPPVRRGLSSLSNHLMPVRGQGHKPDASSAPPIAKGDSDSPKVSQSSSSSLAGNNTPSTSASGRVFIKRLGNCSTFGRNRAPPPFLNEFGEQIQISPSQSARRTGRTNSRRSSRLSSKTTSLHSSPAENKGNTRNSYSLFLTYLQRRMTMQLIMEPRRQYISSSLQGMWRSCEICLIIWRNLESRTCIYRYTSKMGPFPYSLCKVHFEMSRKY
jgi:hypothetical protein